MTKDRTFTFTQAELNQLKYILGTYQSSEHATKTEERILTNIRTKLRVK